MSTTEGVNGNFSPSIHCSFQSSIDRNEARGAAGFARMRSQAASLTVISDMPGGPPRHFCGAADADVELPRVGPNGDAAERGDAVDERQRAVRVRDRPDRGDVDSVPDGVSEWTTVTSSISGCSSR